MHRWQGNEVLRRFGDSEGPSQLNNREFEGWGLEIKIDGMHSTQNFKKKPGSKDTYGPDFYNVDYNPYNGVFYHASDIPNQVIPLKEVLGYTIYGSRPYFFNSSLFSSEGKASGNGVFINTPIPTDSTEFDSWLDVEHKWGLVQYNYGSIKNGWVPTANVKRFYLAGEDQLDGYSDTTDDSETTDNYILASRIIGGSLCFICFVCAGVLFAFRYRKSQKMNYQPTFTPMEDMSGNLLFS